MGGKVPIPLLLKTQSTFKTFVHTYPYMRALCRMVIKVIYVVNPVHAFIPN